MSVIHNVTLVSLIFWVVVLNPHDLLQLINAPFYLMSLPTSATSILSPKNTSSPFCKGGGLLFHKTLTPWEKQWLTKG